MRPRRRRLLLGLALCLASPVHAQDMEGGGQDHGQAHAHDHGQAMEQSPPATTESHAGHGAHAAPQMEGDPVPQGAAPAPPADHHADRDFDPARMRAARALLRRENGGMALSMILLDRLEYRVVRGADGYHWEGGGFIGGDIDRLAFKTEGEGEMGGRLERAELQALYSRAISPYFNLQAGIRHDLRPEPGRSYAVLGIDGLAPYWFDVGAALFLSDKGDLHARIEGSYDQRITQRLILQPQAEVNIAAQHVPRLGVGAGVSTVELGLRLRYEIAREFAPYLGVVWEGKLGRSATYARLAGESRSSAGLAAGIRFWF